MDDRVNNSGVVRADGRPMYGQNSVRRQPDPYAQGGATYQQQTPPRSDRAPYYGAPNSGRADYQAAPESGSYYQQPTGQQSRPKYANLEELERAYLSGQQVKSDDYPPDPYIQNAYKQENAPTYSANPYASAPAQDSYRAPESAPTQNSYGYQDLGRRQSYEPPRQEPETYDSGRYSSYEPPRQESESYEAPRRAAYEPPRQESETYEAPRRAAAYEPPRQEVESYEAPRRNVYEAPRQEYESYEAPRRQSYEAPRQEPETYDSGRRSSYDTQNVGMESIYGNADSDRSYTGRLDARSSSYHKEPENEPVYTAPVPERYPVYSDQEREPVYTSQSDENPYYYDDIPDDSHSEPVFDEPLYTDPPFREGSTRRSTYDGRRRDERSTGQITPVADSDSRERDQSPRLRPDRPQMTTFKWILTLIVGAIPIVGLVMYLIWAFNHNGYLSRRRYCRAWLILWVIMLAFSIIMSVILLQAFKLQINNILQFLNLGYVIQ